MSPAPRSPLPSTSPATPSRAYGQDAEHDDDANTEDELRALLRRVRKVELAARKRVSAQSAGAWSSRFKGRGMSFSESRAFADGDDPRHVDWLATARTGELFVKQFVEERELTLLLVVDISGSMGTGSRELLRRQNAAEVAAILAMSAGRSQDKVGLVAFGAKPERLVRPAKGRAHTLRVVRDVLALRPSTPGTNLLAALDVAGHLTRTRSIIAVVSDLVGVTIPVERLSALSARHDVVVVELQDGLDGELPDVGLLSIRDPETGYERLVDSSDHRVRKQFADSAVAAAATRQASLRLAGCDHVVVRVDDDDTLRPLLRLLRQRRRRGG